MGNVGPDTAPERQSLRPSGAALTALVTASLGFFCSLSSRTVVTVNGERSCSAFDAAPVVIGVVAIAAGVATLAVRRPHHRLAVEIPAAIAGIVLGVLHLLRGTLNIFGELC